MLFLGAQKPVLILLMRIPQETNDARFALNEQPTTFIERGNAREPVTRHIRHTPSTTMRHLALSRIKVMLQTRRGSAQTVLI